MATSKLDKLVTQTHEMLLAPKKKTTGNKYALDLDTGFFSTNEQKEAETSSVIVYSTPNPQSVDETTYAIITLRWVSEKEAAAFKIEKLQKRHGL